MDQKTLKAFASIIMWVELGLLTISLLLALIYHKLDTMVKICPAHFHQQDNIIEVLEASKVVLEMLVDPSCSRWRGVGPKKAVFSTSSRVEQAESPAGVFST